MGIRKFWSVVLPFSKVIYVVKVLGSTATNYAIFRKLYSVEQLLYTADFSEEVLSGFYSFNEVLAEVLYLKVG